MLAPKGGLLVAPLFVSKFLVGAPWLPLAVSGAFIKKAQISIGMFVGLNFTKFLKRVVIPKSKRKSRLFTMRATNSLESGTFTAINSPANRYISGGIRKLIEFTLITAGVFAASQIMGPELISKIENFTWSALNGLGFSKSMEFGLILSKIAGLGIVAGSIVMKLPQVLKIAKNKSAEGISPESMYFDVSSISILFNLLY